MTLRHPSDDATHHFNTLVCCIIRIYVASDDTTPYICYSILNEKCHTCNIYMLYVLHVCNIYMLHPSDDATPCRTPHHSNTSTGVAMVLYSISPWCCIIPRNVTYICCIRATYSTYIACMTSLWMMQHHGDIEYSTYVCDMTHWWHRSNDAT